MHGASRSTNTRLRPSHTGCGGKWVEITPPATRRSATVTGTEVRIPRGKRIVHIGYEALRSLERALFQRTLVFAY